MTKLTWLHSESQYYVNSSNQIVYLFHEPLQGFDLQSEKQWRRIYPGEGDRVDEWDD